MWPYLAFVPMTVVIKQFIKQDTLSREISGRRGNFIIRDFTVKGGLCYDYADSRNAMRMRYYLF